MRLRINLCVVLCAVLIILLNGEVSYAESHPACSSGGEHDYVSHVLVMNTEDTEGQVENTCTICGYSYIEYLPRTGHNFGDWQVTEEQKESRTERRVCLGCGRDEVRTVTIEPQVKKSSSVNQMDYVLSASIGGVWGCAALALWYNSLVLNWYKRECLKHLKTKRPDINIG